MKKIIFILLLFTAALTQATLANGVRVFGVKPDLLWIMVFVAGLYFDLSTAVVFGLMCGILKDCLGVVPFGVYTVLLPLWSLVVNSLSKRISFDHLFVGCIFLSVMIFANAVIVRSLPLPAAGTLSMKAFLRIGILEAVYTSLVFVWLGPWLRRVAVSTLW